MTHVFDPFGDFETKGYLRNTLGEKNLHEVKSMEHIVFLSQLPSTLDWLAIQPLTYDTLLQTHQRLFADFYPWAGQDRLTLLPNTTVKKGEIVFANPEDVESAVVDALQQKSSANVLSQLAFAHPFLDGNGRAIFVLFAEHQRRHKKLVRFDHISKGDLGHALGKSIAGHPQQLSKILHDHTVRFPFATPGGERVSRVFSAIDWSGDGHTTAYEAQPTLLHKIVSRFTKR